MSKGRTSRAAYAKIIAKAKPPALKPVMLPIRMSEELHGYIAEAAEEAGVSMSEFIRSAAEKAVWKPCKACDGTGTIGR